MLVRLMRISQNYVFWDLNKNQCDLTVIFILFITIHILYINIYLTYCKCCYIFILDIYTYTL